MLNCWVIRMSDAFHNGRTVIRTIENSGYEAYFVGGCVRDYLIGRKIKDIDITTDAAPDTVESLFDKTIDIGKQHGTIIVMINNEQIEVTTYRTETTYSDFRRPDQVSFTSSLAEDLKRRDFTVNAIAMSEEMTVIDPNNGQIDIERRLIQTVGEAEARFGEDALRMIRALRFSVQLQFDISDQTFEAITRYAHLIAHVSIERIVVEVKKMYEANQIFKYKKTIVDSGILQYVPALNTMDYSLFQHLKTDSLHTELAAQIYFNHVNRNALKQLRISNDEITYIEKIVTLIEATRSNFKDARLLAYQFTKEILDDCISLLDKNITLFDMVDVDFIQEAQSAFAHLPIYNAGDLAIDGHDILRITNRSPGRWLREVIQSLETNVLLGKLNNDRESLTDWMKTYDDYT